MISNLKYSQNNLKNILVKSKLAETIKNGLQWGKFLYYNSYPMYYNFPDNSTYDLNCLLRIANLVATQYHYEKRQLNKQKRGKLNPPSMIKIFLISRKSDGKYFHFTTIISSTHIHLKGFS